MTTLREAARQAQHALEAITGVTEMDDVTRINQAIDALRQALEADESAYQRGYLDGMAKGRRDQISNLAEQQDEPAAWLMSSGDVITDHPAEWGRCEEWFTPLYTRPQPKQQPLTDEQILIAAPYLLSGVSDWTRAIVRAIERAHGIGGEA